MVSSSTQSPNCKMVGCQHSSVGRAHPWWVARHPARCCRNTADESRITVNNQLVVKTVALVRGPERLTREYFTRKRKCKIQSSPFISSMIKKGCKRRMRSSVRFRVLAQKCTSQCVHNTPSGAFVLVYSF